MLQASDASKKSKRSSPPPAVEVVKLAQPADSAPLRLADRHSFVSLTTYFGEPVGGFSDPPAEQLDLAAILPARGPGAAFAQEPASRTDLPGAFDDLAL